jgi:hypothetical protein
LTRVLGNVPVKYIQRVVDGMELSNLLEEGPTVVSKIIVGEEGDRGSSPGNMLAVWNIQGAWLTYGQEIIETSKMPTIIALLTL